MANLFHCPLAGTKKRLNDPVLVCFLWLFLPVIVIQDHVNGRVLDGGCRLRGKEGGGSGDVRGGGWLIERSEEGWEEDEKDQGED